MPWAFNDFEPGIWHECPLDKDTFEPYFGIVSTDGRLKPSGRELSEFARFVTDNQITRYSFGKAELAILVPKGYYAEIKSAFRRIYTTFILAKCCSAEVDFVWDDQDLTKYKLILIPSARQLTTPIWHKIREYVQNGGIIYHIFDHQSGLSVYFNDLFGVEVQTVARNFDYDTLYFASNWGGYSAGDAIKLLGSGIDEYLKVEAKTAEVIGVFEDRMPAVLRNRHGKGAAYLVTMPIESGFIDIRYRDFLGNGLFGIYDILMDEADITRRAKCSDHRVEVGVLRDRAEEGWMLICINHDAAEVNARLYLDSELAGTVRQKAIFDLNNKHDVQVHGDENEPVYIDLSLGPAGVNAYRI